MEKPFSAEAVAAMHKAAQGFVGRHDFSAVRDKADDEKDAVRQVFSASVTAEGDLISFRVRADGFLYHMVRIMTGTLVAVGRGKIPPESIAKRLASLDRTAFGVTAPPDGLYLDSVTYHHFEF
jgi:tRNA pseudouridine38-40 synthase